MNSVKIISKIILIAVVAIVMFGAFLFVCEDVLGVTPHFYFTKYVK